MPCTPYVGAFYQCLEPKSSETDCRKACEDDNRRKEDACTKQCVQDGGIYFFGSAHRSSPSSSNTQVKSLLNSLNRPLKDYCQAETLFNNVFNDALKLAASDTQGALTVLASLEGTARAAGFEIYAELADILSLSLVDPTLVKEQVSQYTHEEPASSNLKLGQDYDLFMSIVSDVFSTEDNTEERMDFFNKIGTEFQADIARLQKSPLDQQCLPIHLSAADYIMSLSSNETIPINDFGVGPLLDSNSQKLILDAEWNDFLDVFFDKDSDAGKTLLNAMQNEDGSITFSYLDTPE